MKNKIRVAVVDDQLLFRKGIISLLGEFDELTVSFEAESGNELMDKLKTHVIDVVLLDLEMPIMNGLEATKLMKEKYPQIKIIILTMHNDEEFVVELLQKGASGFLLKNQDIEIVVDAIYSVIETGFYYNSTISEKLAHGLVNGHQVSSILGQSKFTDNELKVIELVCKQNTNKQIAEILNLSVRTVDGYMERIFTKTGMKNRTGLVMYAVRNKLIVKGF